MDSPMEHKHPPFLSTLLYGLSIGIILIHLQRLAVPIADMAFYIGSLVLGFILAILGVRREPPLRQWGPWLIALFPWLIKGLVLVICFVIPPKQVPFDRLLLYFERNFLLALFPFYWMALSTFMAARSFQTLHWNRILNGLFVICLFLVIKSRQFSFYVWPTEMLAIFVLVMILQFASLMAAFPLKSSITPASLSLTLLVLLIFGNLTVISMRKNAEEQATEQGGGLIKPNLFRFDFSQFLRLESEISLKEDLVLIVHKDPEDSHIFIRRYILSGYDTNRGFYRDSVKDEAEHPQELPPAELLLQTPQWKDRRSTEQEYFLVNFDPSAFIGMNTPRLISSLKTWDTTSFSSAYRVQSETSEAMPFELIDAVAAKDYTTTKLGLSDQEYQWYTNYGKDLRIKELGDHITVGLEIYWDKVQAIYEYLKNGDYRYSLKPGIATNGDQLGRFLFETKRGYCSYFAFAMTLLLRSQGIPARVAVGFFIDPDTGAFNYYPILSNMAHAWVEVYYPDYGWIEYDPTTSFLAEGEIFRFSQGAQQNTFERLLGEILQNRDKLALISQEPSQVPSSLDISAMIRSAGNWLKHRWYWLIFGIYMLSLVVLRYGYFVLSWYYLTFTDNSRLAAKFSFIHSLRILRITGIYRPKQAQGHTLQEHIKKAEQEQGITVTPLFSLYQEALFSHPKHTISPSSIRDAYNQFIGSYKKAIPLIRRLMAQTFPFASMALSPKTSRLKLFIIILLAGSLIQEQSSLIAQSTSGLIQNNTAQEIIGQAQKLRQEERWEQAIELLQKGAELFPLDSRFHTELGAIYTNRGLYNLAWDEYRLAETLDPENSDLWYELSSVAGRLNKHENSIQYLQRILAQDPDNRDTIGDLGWMYFKTHRLTEGEQLLTQALERLGPDQGLEMTLATIYSDQYRYEDAKAYYIKAIKHAEKSGFSLFLAVAYYNLSILESRFYHFAEAFNSTNASLQYTERASGHLARGELYQRRLDFIKAHAEYLTAYELDTSPLSKINLAQLYQLTGNLAEAQTYAEKTIEQRDLSWMINYGTDLDRYKKDLHQILRDTYRGLANQERLRYKSNIWQQIHSFTLWIQYSMYQIWHEQLCTYYTLQAADAYGVENQKLDALLHYFTSLQQYPWRAKPYLQEAMDYETARIEASLPSYLYELGKLEQNAGSILQAISLFDPVWERDMIADAYAELAKIYKRQRNIEASQANIEALYALNRGSLLQRGLELPITIEIKGDFANLSEERAYKKAITTILDHSGLRINNREAGRYRLLLNRQATTIKAELWDRIKGKTIREGSIPITDLSQENRRTFSLELQKILFSELR